MYKNHCSAAGIEKHKLVCYRNRT